jgi:hypothetical protein
MSRRRDPILRCTVHCGASNESVSQLFSGFALLHRAGVVDVTIAGTEGTPLPRSWWGLGVETADGVRIAYDTADGPRVNPAAVNWCDHYFKRSLSPTFQQDTGNARVSPMGLSYAVYADGDWRFTRMWRTARAIGRKAPRRTAASVVRLGQWLSALTGDTFGRANCSVETFEAAPSATRDPTVFRIARTWDPSTVKDAPDQADRWAELNRSRAEIVRTLRRELGDRFIGGLVPTPDAQRDYPDCLLPDHLLSGPNRSKRRNFLSLIKASDVCVASTGLWGCIPWSLAEYVAASRAIVSEPLASLVPGAFRPDHNYISYTDPRGCVDAVVALLEDDDRRLTMMQANFEYYRDHLRPDALVWNTLQVATGPESRPSTEPPTGPAG